MNFVASVLNTKTNKAYKYVNKCIQESILQLFKHNGQGGELEAIEYGLNTISTIKRGNNLYKIIISTSYNPQCIKGLMIQFQVVLNTKNISEKSDLYFAEAKIFDQSSYTLQKEIIDYLQKSIDTFNGYFNSIYIGK